VAQRLGAPEFQVTSSEDELGVFERVLSAHLRLSEHAEPAEAIDRTVDEVTAAAFEGFCARERIGDPPLIAYAAGDPDAPAVVIVAACGMPARLTERWIRFLARDHRVLTWETRGLFGGHAGTERVDVAAQADDLFAVMDHFGVARAHLMCLCGGAVIGLAAAHRDLGRVESLSLWHGDFAAVPAAERTHHQQNLVALMEMGAADPAKAAAIHPVLCQTMLSAVPPDLAHLVVYPYATPDLLFRYSRLNGEIMKTDVTPWLPEIRRPVLVVTSTDDQTAHPDGSKVVARSLPDAVLHIRPHGDHISLFKGEPELLNLVGKKIIL
jgi:pimeloyl-ACP methyl ester carboxylesterase